MPVIRATSRWLRRVRWRRRRKIKRLCFANEIEPKYVAVALQRMADMGLHDFGILKWSTSAVCFGPPTAQQTSTLDLSVSLSLEAGVGLESQGGAIRADSVGV